MKLRHFACVATLLTSGFCFAQTDVTCHITPFEGPSSSGLSQLYAAKAVNRYGNAVGTYSAVSGGKYYEHAYIRFNNGTVSKLNIGFSNTSYLDVYKRNASGVTIGDYQLDTATATGGGFVIANGVTTAPYRLPDGTYAIPTGINRYGSIVGAISDGAGNYTAFKVKDGALTYIPVPASFNRDLAVTGISDTGVIVGNYALPNSDPDPDQTTHGFLIANGQWKDFAYPNRVNTYIEDINASGEIVGILDDPNPDEAFIYKNGTFYHPVFTFPDGTSKSSQTRIWGVNGYGEISGDTVVSTVTKPFVGTCALP